MLLPEFDQRLASRPGLCLRHLQRKNVLWKIAGRVDDVKERRQTYIIGLRCCVQQAKILQMRVAITNSDRQDDGLEQRPERIRFVMRTDESVDHSCSDLITAIVFFSI